jgi:acetyl-CoA carboxylase/biotin carboxylase 1
MAFALRLIVGGVKRLALERTEVIKRDAVASEISELMRHNREGGIKGVMTLLSTLPTAEKEELIKLLSKA